MRKQVSVHLFYACLLLTASPLNHIHFTINAHAAESAVHFKLRTLEVSTMPHAGHIIPSWGDEKRRGKSPSGPNPIGNQRPPARPESDDDGKWKQP